MTKKFVHSFLGFIGWAVIVIAGLSFVFGGYIGIYFGMALLMSSLLLFVLNAVLDYLYHSANYSKQNLEAFDNHFKKLDEITKNQVKAFEFFQKNEFDKNKKQKEDINLNKDLEEKEDLEPEIIEKYSKLSSEELYNLKKEFENKESWRLLKMSCKNSKLEYLRRKEYDEHTI